MRRFLFLSCLLVTGGIIAALTLDTDTRQAIQDHSGETIRSVARMANQPNVTPSAEVDCDFCPQRIASCAAELDHYVRYVPDYVRIPFPMGDVPDDTGVCTDVVIRALRCAGLDLQEEVFKHRKRKGKSTDTNIDHRRVPNIGAYLADHPDWKVIPVDQPVQPGDIVWWKVGRKRSNHVGIAVTDTRVMHNIGHGVWADARPDSYALHRIYRLR